MRIVFDAVVVAIHGPDTGGRPLVEYVVLGSGEHFTVDAPRLDQVPILGSTIRFGADLPEA